MARGGRTTNEETSNMYNTRTYARIIRAEHRFLYEGTVVKEKKDCHFRLVCCQYT